MNQKTARLILRVTRLQGGRPRMGKRRGTKRAASSLTAGAKRDALQAARKALAASVLDSESALSHLPAA